MNSRTSFLRCLSSFMLILFFYSSFSFAEEINFNDIYNNHPSFSSTSLPEKNYLELKEMLPIYENALRNPWPSLPDTRLLKVGIRGHDVLLLRDRLKSTGELVESNPKNRLRFDSELKEAVINFQERNGLKADGVVGKDTRAALNVTPEERVKQIELNIQRWEKLSTELGDRYVLVNIPAFHLDLVEKNQIILSMKVIVGKPTRQTPELSSKITRVIFNPYWDVPDMIAQKDIIPKILANPNYLYEMNIKIYNRDGDGAYQIPPYEVNWYAAEENGFRYHFRQEPGAINALGLVKFEFANEHNVYLHDTPAKPLFDQEVRDFSSGCIRLEKPFDLVEYFVQSDSHFDPERIQNMMNEGKTRYVSVSKPLPIYITYITAWVNAEGKIEFRDDVYQRDNPAADIPQESSTTQ